NLLTALHDALRDLPVGQKHGGGGSRPDTDPAHEGIDTPGASGSGIRSQEQPDPENAALPPSSVIGALMSSEPDALAAELGPVPRPEQTSAHQDPASASPPESVPASLSESLAVAGPVPVPEMSPTDWIRDRDARDENLLFAPPEAFTSAQAPAPLPEPATSPAELNLPVAEALTDLRPDDHEQVGTQVDTRHLHPAADGVSEPAPAPWAADRVRFLLVESDGDALLLRGPDGMAEPYAPDQAAELIVEILRLDREAGVVPEAFVLVGAGGEDGRQDLADHLSHRMRTPVWVTGTPSRLEAGADGIARLRTEADAEWIRVDPPRPGSLGEQAFVERAERLGAAFGPLNDTVAELEPTGSAVRRIHLQEAIAEQVEAL
ncbi:hypothetical protein ACWD5V_42820, partial [Streptomyces sp. NPDC002523]